MVNLQCCGCGPAPVVAGLPDQFENGPETGGPAVHRQFVQAHFQPGDAHPFGREPAFVAAVQAAGVHTWLVCGIEAHICVYQTSLHLHDLGYGVELVGDCITSRAAAYRELAIARLGAKGVGITGLEMCLYELAVDCRAACFQPILEFIR